VAAGLVSSARKILQNETIATTNRVLVIAGLELNFADINTRVCPAMRGRCFVIERDVGLLNSWMASSVFFFFSFSRRVVAPGVVVSHVGRGGA